MSVIADLPDIRPSLLLDFANSGRVHPLIQSTRASTATCYGPDGKLRTLAANVPCIDYDQATGRSLGLFVGRGFSNIIRASERMWDTAYWMVGESLGGGVFASAAESYDVKDIYGATGATTKFTTTAQADTIFARQSLALILGAKHASVFIYVPTQAGVNEYSIMCDAEDSESSVSASVRKFDAWVRVTVEFSVTAPRSWLDFNILVNGTYAPQGFNFYAMGAQLVEGDIADLPYVKTAPSPAYRAPDFIVLSGVEFAESFGGDEWSFVLEAKKSRLSFQLWPRYLSINDGSLLNEIQVADQGPGFISVGSAYNGSGITEAVEGAGEYFKLAVAFKDKRLRLSVDGKPVRAVYTPNRPAATRLELGSSLTMNPMTTVSRLQVYARALSDAQLQRMTQA